MNKKRLLLSLIASVTIQSGFVHAMPVITGQPNEVQPQLLNWKRDFNPSTPDLTEPTSNRIYDLHSHIKECDIVLSTSGNYHMVLGEYWYDFFLPNNPDIKNWIYTTSPPISVDHSTNSELSIGNWKTNCKPSIMVGPKKIMAMLKNGGLISGEPIPVIQNQGNVLLVKKGNPKNINNIYDLARKDVRVVTSNPYTEPGSFGNYSSSIYNIANFNQHLSPQRKLTADKLFNLIFGNRTNKGNKGKWVSGKRIHHREVPWAIAYNKADVGPMFYHLAKYAKESFPDQFDIVPLGGTVENPSPLDGNKIGTLFIARASGTWTDKQLELREKVVQGFLSDDFTQLLEAKGLKRPIVVSTE